MDLHRLCVLYLRSPQRAYFDGANYTMTFEPPLSAPEQAIFDDLVQMSQAFVLTITLAEWQAIKTDAAGLITYQNLASPTAAQTALAVKAQSRILKAILRS